MAAEVSDLARGDLLEHHHPVALLEGQAEAGKQAVAVLLRYGEFVGLYLDAMELVAVELHAVGDLSQLPVDADGEEALLTKLLEELFVMPLTLLDDGSQ